MENNTKIVHASAYIDALKSSGYKSTYNAIAEIVDNSIDADAKDIFIIGEQKIAGNGEKRIVSFAFLDNGKGMDYEILKNCLTIGYTTNQARKGMGRFGVGLPQASVFVCNRVEVYSWQNGFENCQKVYLDLDEVKEKDLNEIAAPVKVEFPSKYKKFLSWNSDGKTFDFNQNGTLVLWTKCTAVDHKKWNTCVSHMSEDLGRKYRYFLHDKSISISMIEYVSSSFEKMYPNDPLYLMTPSQECLPSDIDTFIKNGYQSRPYNPQTGYTESLFEKYQLTEDASSEVELEIKYEEADTVKTGKVKIKYSVVKSKYYSISSLKTDKKPGTSLPFGKSSKLVNNIGISIVRNGREIDFGSFGFFNYYNVPEYRWWGIEISFDSSLDSAFGISNNKQYVNLKPMSKQEMSEVDKNELKTVWHQLADDIMDTISQMDNRNSKVRSENKSTEDPTPPQSSQISNKVDVEMGLVEEEPELTEEEKEEQAIKQLVNEGNEKDEVTKVQVQQLIDSKVRVVTVFNKGKNDSFIDNAYAAGTLSIIINANHPFYKILVSKIMDEQDSKIPFELFVMAVMKSIKELNVQYEDAMDTLMYNLNLRITNYIKEYMK